MKNTIIILLCAMSVMGGCASASFDSVESSSWASHKNSWEGTIHILSVSAEKSGEWGILEREICDLMPLLFSEEAYLVVSPSTPADYSAEVKIRERDYTDRWQTKHSLSAEVRIWKEGKDFSVDEPLPLSAGRALLNGRQSFASSKTVSSLLRKAVRNAVHGLPSLKKEAVKQEVEK